MNDIKNVDSAIDSSVMKKIFLLSVAEIEKVLNGEAEVSDKSKTALRTLGHYSKLKAHESSSYANETARFKVQYSVIKDIAQNKKELKSYVKSTSPSMIIT